MNFDQMNADEWARWDAESIEMSSARLLSFYQRHNRLPVPCAARVRAVHERLSRIVEQLDAKKEELAA